MNWEIGSGDEEKEFWLMPEWMEKYILHIDTNPHPYNDLKTKIQEQVNTPKFLQTEMHVETIIKVRLLTNLNDAGLLSAPYKPARIDASCSWPSMLEK